MSLRVMVDLRNPGQFFAACGLFELAARLAPNVEGHFDEHAFVTTTGPSLPEVLDAMLNSVGRLAIAMNSEINA